MKKGELAWETLALIILGLLLIVIAISFSTIVREKAANALASLGSMLFGR
tara:strand:+ start:461 stop:610 length:150 start_codon:yes stop_codon:yes gene_type:complete